jgi:DNA-binding CsgD family transcriptional regulator
VRRQLIGDAAWYGSEQYNDYHRVSRIDDFIDSIYEDPAAPGAVHVIGMYRAVGEAPFSARDSRKMLIFHDELRRKPATVLSRETAPRAAMSPRMRQTLERLLQGNSEKQVARLLGISRPTAHQYVTALYRHFGVTSRSELMAQFVPHGAAAKP